MTMSRREVLFFFLAFAAILVLGFAVRGFFVDDAFIGFRYIDNALHGHGFVFNPPDRIEGVTNIGWLLVLLPFAWIVPVTVAAKILSLILVLATLAMLIRFASRALQTDRVIVLLLPLLIAANLDFTYFSLSGMETPLAGFGLILMLVLAEQRPSFPALALIGAFLFLARPECILIFPLFLVFHNGTSGASWKRSAWSILFFASLITLLTLARKSYFGLVLPNTFFAKSTSWGVIAENVLRFIKGTNTNISFPFLGWLALPVWANGLRLSLKKDRKTGSFLTAALATGLFFGLYAKPDWTGMGRYFAPYVPIAMFVFLTGFADLIRMMLAFLTKSRRVVPVAVGLFGAAFIANGCVGTILFLQPDRLEDYPGYVLTGESLIEPSLWMRDHLPEESVIATGRIGAVAYYSKKRIFDYKFGLTEPAVAGLRRTAREPFEDPRDPALAKTWTDVNPGYFLEDLRRIRTIFRLGSEKIEALTIHGRDYRPLKAFPIGLDAVWILCERVDLTPGAAPEKPIDHSAKKR
jgi:hypothetical protein